MTIYLLFPDAATAETVMVAAGYQLTEYKDHFQPAPVEGETVAPQGWGTLRAGDNGHEVNIYDAESVPTSLQQYVTPEPLTPNNIRAGDEVNVIFKSVIVTAAIRDTARSLVVAMAGQTHAAMWSQGLSADGQLPATHYINSGLVRAEMAALLQDADLLSAATGMTLPEAQYILSQCVVSDVETLGGLQVIA